MKILSKLAFLLFLAGLLAILISFAGFGPRGSRIQSKTPVRPRDEPSTVTTQPQPASRTRPGGSDATQKPAEETGVPHIRIPAIRGESYYGWVQLPRGTSVELVRQSADNLIVRWEGTTVKVPLTAAVNGAIALRQAPRLAVRN